MKDKPTIVFELKKFDGVANKVAFSEIKENMLKCERIDIIPKEKIVKLNIRWGELYCKCTNDEWAEFYKILGSNNIKIKRRSFLGFL